LGENDLQEFGAISHKLNHSIEKKHQLLLCILDTNYLIKMAYQPLDGRLKKKNKFCNYRLFSLHTNSRGYTSLQ
jgi:hypothetical protein